MAQGSRKADRRQNRLLFRKVRRANRQRDAGVSYRGRQGEHSPISGIGAPEHMSDGQAHKHECGDSNDRAVADQRDDGWPRCEEERQNAGGERHRGDERDGFRDSRRDHGSNMSDKHSRHQWRKNGHDNQLDNWRHLHVNWHLEKLTKQFDREWNENNRDGRRDHQQSDRVGWFAVGLDLLFWEKRRNRRNGKRHKRDFHGFMQIEGPDNRHREQGHNDVHRQQRARELRGSAEKGDGVARPGIKADCEQA